MANKRNYLARQQFYRNLQLREFQMAVTQEMFDAALLAAREEYRIGPVRASRFIKTLKKNFKEMVELMDFDYDNTKSKELIYASAKIDKALKEFISDEDFIPWEKRYEGTPLAPRKK